jgi:hypothetical protein
MAATAAAEYGNPAENRNIPLTNRGMRVHLEAPNGGPYPAAGSHRRGSELHRRARH